jgi:heme/copper-type cytochrome/quinol oxidase subunit 2
MQMRSRLTFVLLVIVGLVTLSSAAYTQWMSLPPAHAQIANTVWRSVGVWAWWTVVGIPSLNGLVLIGLGAYGFVQRPTPRTEKWTFVVALAISTIALPIGGVIIFPFVSTGVLCAIALLRKRPRSSD